VNRWPLAWIVIVALAGPGLGCGKYGPPIRSEYPVPTRPDWVVVPEPPPAPAGASGEVEAGDAPDGSAAEPTGDGATPAEAAPTGPDTQGQSQP